jgi:hypothetical protein
MHRTTRDRLRFGTLALGAILVAAPGVHLFEVWLDHSTAVWVSHGLAIVLLVATFWRWRIARARDTTLEDGAV